MRVSKKDNLFVASRFVLPEHREMYLQDMEDQKLVPMPNLEEDELDEIHYRVIDARQYDRAVTVRWWHPVKRDLGEIREVWGWVKDLDPTAKRIKLMNDDEVVWLDVSKIVEVRHTV